MAVRVLADISGIRKHIAHIITTPGLYLDELELMVSGGLEPGYEVWFEGPVMWVITPKVGFSSNFRKELYDAIGGFVL